QFHFCSGQIPQTILPFGLQSASDQAIFRLHGPIAPLGSLRFIASALYFQTPLRQSSVVVGLELFDRQPSRFDRRWRDGFQKSIRYGLLNRCPADVETVHAASVDQIFAGAVITGSRVPSALMNVQTAATVPTGGNALQQRRSLSHRTSWLMRLRPRVGIQPC